MLCYYVLEKLVEMSSSRAPVPFIAAGIAKMPETNVFPITPPALPELKYLIKPFWQYPFQRESS